jgi:hypothetical protein
VNVYWSGNTDGWATGIITIDVYLYVNGTETNSMSNECDNSTSCGSPDATTPVSGAPDLKVIALGCRVNTGCTSDTKTIYGARPGGRADAAIQQLTTR